MVQRGSMIVAISGSIRARHPSAHVLKEHPLTEETSLSRRRLLQRLALGVSVVPMAVAVRRAHADLLLPLLSVGSSEAAQVHYVEDATKAGFMPVRGAKCANCSLYRGSSGSSTGPCDLFPDKAVMAAGWCSSWHWRVL